MSVDALIQVLQKRSLKIATAESCTGGGIAFHLTSKAGSSAWFDRGWVAYTVEAKSVQLKVPEQFLIQTAVSADVAAAMASGALIQSRAQSVIAVTGVAGPTGGNADCPVGCCWFGFAVGWSLGATIDELKEGRHITDVKIMSVDATASVVAVRCDFPGEREATRAAAIKFSCQYLARLIEL